MNYYAVGDIHGMLDAFRRILMYIDADKPNEPRKIILLGDYIDRGPDSKGVIDLIIRLQNERGADNVIALMGNHEDMALHDWRLWVSNGGQETMKSYGGDDDPARDISQEHRAWMRKLPRYYETNHNIFVHAGIDDQPFIPMDQQSNSFLLWKRFHKGYNPNITKVLVHGHTPGAQVEMLPNRINLDTAAVFGGCLTAAKFGSDSGQPIKFFNTLF
jgi:serine/threonine protein phosphatase 1